MTDDLGVATQEVHASPAGQAREVLDFWFALSDEQHFAKDDALDAEIARRFGALQADLLKGGADGWRGDAQRMLAAIIVLDQFSRNIHRGSPEAFAADDLAVQLTLEAVRAGHDLELAPDRRTFLYMPLMHAEHLGLQRYGIDLFAEAGLDEQVQFARAHADVIERYGRFPHRNAVLGRDNTPEEERYLSGPDAGW